VNTALKRSRREPAPTALTFREAMAQVASSVHVITTAGAHGDAGITATAVCSVTDSPPMILACLNRASYARSVVSTSRFLAVNTLTASHLSLADQFAGRGDKEMADRFAHGSWTRGVTGSPLLDGALVSFDCTVEFSLPVGSHDIFVCRVVQILRPTPPSGLAYVGRQYFGVDLAGPSQLLARLEKATGDQPAISQPKDGRRVEGRTAQVDEG
jgi:flavin reductase